MDNVIELYSLEELSRQKKKIRIWTALLGLLVLLCLSACIVLLCLTNTANLKTMMVSVIVISALGGCVAIYVALNVVAATARKVSHADVMMSESREIVCGTFTVSKYRVKIKNGITVMHVFVRSGQNMKRLDIDEDRVKMLPGDGAEYVFFTVNNYIVALEKYK